MISLKEKFQIEGRLAKHHSVSLIEWHENDVMIGVKVRCRQCQNFKVFLLRSRDMFNWLVNKSLIQNVWPELTPSERELMVSGMCGTCFDSLFTPVDEER